MNAKVLQSLRDNYNALQFSINAKKAFDGKGNLLKMHRSVANMIRQDLTVLAGQLEVLKEYSHTEDKVRTLMNCAWDLLHKDEKVPHEQEWRKRKRK